MRALFRFCGIWLGFGCFLGFFFWLVSLVSLGTCSVTKPPYSDGLGLPSGFQVFVVCLHPLLLMPELSHNFWPVNRNTSCRINWVYWPCGKEQVEMPLGMKSLKVPGRMAQAILALVPIKPSLKESCKLLQAARAYFSLPESFCKMIVCFYTKPFNKFN